VVLLLSGTAYFILSRFLIVLHGTESALATALGRDSETKASLFIYLVAIPLAFVHAGLTCGLYVLVAVMWLVPDRRIEKTLGVSSE
jgi:uncharacterized membrane protein